MKLGAKIALGVVSAIAAMQLVRCDHDNPPVTGELVASPEVKSVLRRACWDCHSNETKWPWYSQVAPFSWLVARDVHEGRRKLNFSTWSSLADDKRARKRRESGKEVAEGEMPLWFYTPLHREAALSPEDVKLLRAWADGAD